MKSEECDASSQRLQEVGYYYAGNGVAVAEKTVFKENNMDRKIWPTRLLVPSFLASPPNNESNVRTISFF